MYVSPFSQYRVENWIKIGGKNWHQGNTLDNHNIFGFCYDSMNSAKIQWSHFQLGCARFAEILQNFSELQILWSLCLVVFRTLTPILIVFKLHFLWRLYSQFLWILLKIFTNSGKRAHPWVRVSFAFKITVKFKMGSHINCKGILQHPNGVLANREHTRISHSMWMRNVS